MKIYMVDDALTLVSEVSVTVASKCHLGVLVAPPSVDEGYTARWVTSLHPVVDTVTFGDPGTGSWEMIEDHRKDTLYTSEGEYKIGDEYEGQSYDGLGSIPTWLSTEAPEPEPATPMVPQSVTRRQARLALLQAGKLETVEQAVEQAGTEAQIEYEADMWERSNVFLQSMWAQLGGTEEDLDDLFVLAATK